MSSLSHIQSISHLNRTAYRRETGLDLYKRACRVHILTEDVSWTNHVYTMPAFLSSTWNLLAVCFASSSSGLIDGLAWLGYKAELLAANLHYVMRRLASLLAHSTVNKSFEQPPPDQRAREQHRLFNKVMASRQQSKQIRGDVSTKATAKCGVDHVVSTN